MLGEQGSARRFATILAIVAVVIAYMGFAHQYYGLPLTEFVGRIFENFCRVISSQLLGVAVTVLIMERLNRKREERLLNLIQSSTRKRSAIKTKIKSTKKVKAAGTKRTGTTAAKKPATKPAAAKLPTRDGKLSRPVHRSPTVKAAG